MQRADIMIETARAYQDLVEEIRNLLETTVKAMDNPSDRALVDLFTMEKEIEPKEDMEQIIALLERYEIPSSAIEIKLDRFKRLFAHLEDATHGGPLFEAVLTPTMLSGQGGQEEEVILHFHENDVEISVQPPHYEDEEDDEYQGNERALRADIEAWLLEDC